MSRFLDWSGMQARDLARNWVPPAMIDIGRRFARHGWSGDYLSWAAAAAHCPGYQESAIVDHVERAVRAVLAGRAAGERDGVVLDRVEPRWPLLTHLFRAAALDGRLSVLDVGGSLGSSWLQHRNLLPGIPLLKWMILEQPEYVRRGRNLFPGGLPAFSEELDEAWSSAPNVVVLSAVLPYLGEPHRMLADIIARGPRWIILDRTPVWDAGRDRITIQRVPARFYKASYPSWIFDRNTLLATFAKNYVMSTEFASADRMNIPGVTFNGWCLERRDTPV